MDALALIRRFVEHFHSDTSSVSTYVGMIRKDLVHWVKERAPDEWKQFPEFAADTLIAAGFGNDDEQRQTIWCRCE